MNPRIAAERVPLISSGSRARRAEQTASRALTASRGPAGRVK